MRYLKIILLLCAAAVAFGLYSGSYAYFKRQELQQATARMSLFRSTLEAELDRFAHLPFILSLDPVVTLTLQGGDPVALDHRLARFAQRAGIEAIYLMDETGLTISSSNARLDSSFKGQNYGFRPYFQDAQRGELGQFYGIGATTGIPGYFYAMAVRPNGTEARGVIAIKLDLSTLQDSWQATGAQILLSNSDGVVLLASDPDWRYRLLSPISESQRDRMIASKQFGTQKLEALDWTPNLTRQTATIGGKRLLYLQTRDLPNSWQLHFFIPDDQVVTRASLTTAVMLFIAVLSLIAYQLRRMQRIGVALQKSEAEEAQLRAANERLAVEIDERRAAERSLQKTQQELERAGRLAALGQLASSVTHELGQPIAAMRNQLAAAEMTSGTSPLNIKMQGLVARMEDITRQLKFFSRKGRDQFERIDIGKVMTDALELLEPSLANAEAQVDYTPPDDVLPVQGNRLRIEQVMTNIVRNATDAVEASDDREITIRMGRSAGHVWFEVADTGHGLGDKSLEDLREPFTTTRESGRGMGLGLTISAGIVSDHGGSITAQNREGGGAVFRITLPAIAEDQPT